MGIYIIVFILAGFSLYAIKKHKELGDKLVSRKTDTTAYRALSLDNELFQKIDKLIDGADHLEHGIEKVYVGSHYWDMLPDWIKWDWVSKADRRGLIPVRKNEVGYRGIKIILDEEHKFTFDVG